MYDKGATKEDKCVKEISTKLGLQVEEETKR